MTDKNFDAFLNGLIDASNEAEPKIIKAITDAGKPLTQSEIIESLGCAFDDVFEGLILSDKLQYNETDFTYSIK